MHWKQWLKQQWLYAQGVPERFIQEGSWNAPDRFWSVPEKCVLCGRPWRPDKPQYIAVFGLICRLIDGYWLEHLPFHPIKTEDLKAHVHGFPRWYAPSLDVMRETGYGEDHVRYLCTEHSDRYKSLVSCITNERIQLSPPPTLLQRAWRDVRYWTLTSLRFVWGLVRHGASCVMHPVRWWKWRKIQRVLEKGPLP